jgi:hypothetical protein
MRESILTIPINEVFEPKSGCPICRMRDTVEQHIAEYIMGAAMMEPDVRQETNALGFCRTHFGMLQKQNNRLSLALMLNTHLRYLQGQVLEKKLISTAKSRRAKAANADSTCFVCAKTRWGMDHMMKTLFDLFAKDKGFRGLFAEQEYICMPHYSYLLEQAALAYGKNGGDYSQFKRALNGVTLSYLKSLNADVNTFCDSFDYRNAGSLHKPGMEQVRDSVQRAVRFLTARE